MTHFHLPSDGSVVIVDDKIEDALPLIGLLSKMGVSSTYYSGIDDDELPDSPVQKVRLAFFDIQLLPSLPSHTSGRRIVDLLTKIIPDNNGPFVLVLWSARIADQADEICELVTAQASPRRPITVICLDKSAFFDSSDNTADQQTLIDLVQEELQPTLSGDDIDRVLETIQRNYIHPPQVKQPKPNAISHITEQLNRNLQNRVDSFQLFTMWETLINKASGSTVKNYADLYKEPAYWDENLKYTIYLLAYAQAAKKVDNLDDTGLVRSAMKTLSQTFLDEVDSKTVSFSSVPASISFDRDNIGFTKNVEGSAYKIKWKASTQVYELLRDGAVVVPLRHQQKKLSDLVKKAKEGLARTGVTADANGVDDVAASFKAITPEINTRLHLDVNAYPSVHPGNVYECTGLGMDKRKDFLKTYFTVGDKDRNLIKSDGRSECDDRELESIKFIELEVTPPCDFAQEKWIKSRILPGVLIPHAMYEKYLISSAESLYKKMPVVRLQDKEYMMLFDYRLFKSENKDVAFCDIVPIFRIRHELYADLISGLSGHVSRLGITSVMLN